MINLEKKQKYIDAAKSRFSGKSLELVLNQIELFYKNNISIDKTNIILMMMKIFGHIQQNKLKKLDLFQV